MATPIVMPNGENASQAELKIAAEAAPTRKAYMRLWCMLVLLQGKLDKATLCDLHDLKLNTLNDWIRRFNASGIDGLIDRKSPGRPPRIACHLEPELKELICNPHAVDITHWTGRKFHGYLTDTLDLEIGYRTVIRWLHENDFRLKVPRPWPDRQDEEQRKLFQAKLQQWLKDESIELWYLDECGVEGDPRPRRRWAQKGDKITVTKNGDHMRMNVTGMICPRTGEFYGLEFSHNDTEIYQTFLNHANQDIKLRRKRNLLIMDNASWHKSKSLKFGNFEPVYLPAYSPDFNPIERLWMLMKAEWFCDFVAKDKQALIHRLDQALNWLMARTAGNQITAAIC
jgi:transposase